VIEPRIDPSADALVTTVIPTYRRPALLKRAIESVLGQTAGTQRIAVYDNASGDDTGAVVLDIARRDPRVRYHRQAANLGPFENFRFGLAEVSTPFFSLLSDDDVLLPRFYETALSALREHPTALFAVTRVLQVDRTGHLLSIEGRSWSPGLHGPPDSVREMLRLGYVTWTGTLFRREVIQRRRDELSQVRGGFGVRGKKGCLRAQVLRMSQCHPGHDTELQRLLRGGDDMLFPISDHDGIPVQVGAARELQMAGQTTADAHSSSST